MVLVAKDLEYKCHSHLLYLENVWRFTPKPYFPFENARTLLKRKKIWLIGKCFTPYQKYFSHVMAAKKKKKELLHVSPLYKQKRKVLYFNNFWTSFIQIHTLCLYWIKLVMWFCRRFSKVVLLSGFSLSLLSPLGKGHSSFFKRKLCKI